MNQTKLALAKQTLFAIVKLSKPVIAFCSLIRPLPIAGNYECENLYNLTAYEVVIGHSGCDQYNKGRLDGQTFGYTFDIAHVTCPLPLRYLFALLSSPRALKSSKK